MEKAHDSSYSSLRPPRVRLPPELWERILLTADLNSLQACCLVSSDLKKVVKDEVFARKWLALHADTIEATCTINTTICHLDSLQIASHEDRVFIHHDRKPIDENSCSDVYSITCLPTGVVSALKKSFPVRNEVERSSCLAQIEASPPQFLAECRLCQELRPFAISKSRKDISKDYRFFVPSWEDQFQFTLSRGQRLTIRLLHSPPLIPSSWSSEDLLLARKRSSGSIPESHYPCDALVNPRWKPIVAVERYGISVDPRQSYRFFCLDAPDDGGPKEDDTPQVSDLIRFMNPFA
ncbi:MAG: hypothetical protein SGCHY_005079 [Lobulomycetales sp.]